MQLATNRVNFFVWLQSFNDERSFQVLNTFLRVSFIVYVTLAKGQVDAEVAILHFVQFFYHFPKLCVVAADATAIALSNFLFVFSVFFVFQCVCESFFCVCMKISVSFFLCVCHSFFFLCASFFFLCVSFFCVTLVSCFVFCFRVFCVLRFFLCASFVFFF